MLASKLFSSKFYIIYLHLKMIMFFVLVPTLKSSYWHRSDRGWRRMIFAFYEVSVVSSVITTVVSTLKMGHWLVRSIRSGEIIVYAERASAFRGLQTTRAAWSWWRMGTAYQRISRTMSQVSTRSDGLSRRGSDPDSHILLSRKILVTLENCGFVDDTDAC